MNWRGVGRKHSRLEALTITTENIIIADDPGEIRKRNSRTQAHSFTELTARSIPAESYILKRHEVS
jgi:hypothetical protein